jgi:hypothetical protein
VNALTDAFRFISAHDYPDRWPSLPDSLSAALRSGDMASALAALRLLRVFAFHYAMKRVPGGGPMSLMAAAILPLVLQVTQYLLTSVDSLDAATGVHIALKFYYSTIDYRLGHYAAACNTPSFIAWMGLCNAVLVKPLGAPAPGGQPVDEDARAAWPWWKAKKWASKIIARVAERYGNPRDYADDDEEENAAVRPLAAVFNKSIAPEVVSTALAQLAAWSAAGGASGDAWLAPRVRQAYLALVASASDFSSVWVPLRPHMPLLIEGVLFSMLRPTAADLEAFESDPEQWLHAQEDILASYVSPAAAAENTLRVLADKRAATTLPIVDKFIRRTFEAVAATPAGARDHGAKDAALRMLGVIASSYEEKRKGRTRAALEALLVSFVTPELGPAAPPLLRVRAMNVWTSFADVKLVSDEAKADACRGMLACLQDTTSVPVRIVAAGSLGFLIGESTACAEVVRPVIAPVIARLFSLLDEVGMESVTRSLSIIVEVYEDSMPELAGMIGANLSSAFLRMLDAGQAPDAEGEEQALACETMLNIFDQLMDLLYTRDAEPVIISSLLPHAWPLLARLLDGERADTTDYLDNALSLLGSAMSVLAEALPAHPAAWAAWVAMQRYVRAHAINWTDAWAHPTDVGIAYGAPRGLFSAPVEVSPGVSVDFAVELATTIEAILVESSEDEAVAATRIVTSLLHYGRGAVDRVLPALLNALVRAFCAAKTEEYRHALALSLASSLAYNAAGSLSVIMPRADELLAPPAARGAAEFLERLFREFDTLSKPVDIKIAALGLSAVVADAAAGRLPPALAAALPTTVALAVSLVHKEGAELARVAASAAERTARRAAADDDSSGGAESGGDAAASDDDDAGGGGGDDGGGADDGSYVESEDGYGGGDEEDDDEDAPATSSPLDHVDTTLFFSRAMSALLATPAWPTVAAALPETARALLGACAAAAATLTASGRAAGELGPTDDERRGIPPTATAADAAAGSAGGAAAMPTPR